MKIEQPYQLYREVGINIVRLCKERRITQAELAFRCDIEGPNINRIIHGGTDLTLKGLWKISKSLGVEIVDLFKGIEN